MSHPQAHPPPPLSPKRANPRNIPSHGKVWPKRVTKLRKGIELTDKDDIELETTLQELVLDLLRDRVETDIRRGADFFSHFLLAVRAWCWSH